MLANLLELVFALSAYALELRSIELELRSVEHHHGLELRSTSTESASSSSVDGGEVDGVEGAAGPDPTSAPTLSSTLKAASHLSRMAPSILKEKASGRYVNHPNPK